MRIEIYIVDFFRKAQKRRMNCAELRTKTGFCTKVLHKLISANHTKPKVVLISAFTKGTDYADINIKYC